MEKSEIQNLIKEIIEKTTIQIKEITIDSDEGNSSWVSIQVSEPRYFTDRDGEGLHALNHIIHRIIESRSPRTEGIENKNMPGVLIDINGFQKKHVENIRAVAHMMGERARYFKANVEVDPMSAFERRIVHEFLSTAEDLKTESVGIGKSRRVVIKYVGNI